MTHFITNFASFGSAELLVLLAILLFYVAPIWLSIRIYGRAQPHWRDVSIFASMMASWIGFIIVRSIRAGVDGYSEGRTNRNHKDTKPPRS